MTTATCDYCLSALGRTLIATDRNRRITAAEFEYARCSVCDSWSMVTRPGNVGEYYPDNYIPRRTATELRSSFAAERYRIEFLTRHGVLPGARVVEVGPGDGSFAALATDAGMQVAIVERTEEACAHLSDLLGVEAVCSSSPESVLGHFGSIDAIVAWHVLEHLPCPREFLEASAAALRPGGLLVIAAPNPRATTFRIMGARWPHLDAPRHHSLPDPRGIARALPTSMECIEITDRDPGSRHWEGFAWHYLLRNPATSKRTDRALQLAGAAVAKGSFAVRRSGLGGSAYTAVYRKADSAL